LNRFWPIPITSIDAYPSIIGSIFLATFYSECLYLHTRHNERRRNQQQKDKILTPISKITGVRFTCLSQSVSQSLLMLNKPITMYVIAIKYNIIKNRWMEKKTSIIMKIKLLK